MRAFFVSVTLLFDVSLATTVTTGLVDRYVHYGGHIDVEMLDFDKTIVTDSFGGEVLMICDPNCSYESCDCKDDGMITTLMDKMGGDAAVIESFGGRERLARFADHLRIVRRAGVDLYIVSTSWYAVTGEEWANFIYACLDLVGLAEYFPIEKILTLADPGEGISADKGIVVRQKLSELGKAPGQAVFCDDSEGNFLSAVQGQLSADTVYVQPRAGLSVDDLQYIERRAITKTKADTVPERTFSVTRNVLDPVNMKATTTMYDFDKTLVTNSFGAIILDICDPDCSYERCKCDRAGKLTKALLAMDEKERNEALMTTFGGQDRLDRLHQHLVDSEARCIKRYMVSTSWYTVRGKDWGDFIFETLKLVGLEKFFPRENILTLADPGEGVSADKGSVIADKLAELGLDVEEAIFMDDSEGNFLSAVQGTLKAETIYVQPRAGLDSDAFSYVEMRSGSHCTAFDSFEDVQAAAQLSTSEPECNIYLGKWINRRQGSQCAPPKKANKVKCKKLKGSPLCSLVGCKEQRGRCLGQPKSME